MDTKEISGNGSMLRIRLILSAEFAGLLFFVLFFAQPERASSRLAYCLTGVISIIGFLVRVKTGNNPDNTYDIGKCTSRKYIPLAFGILFGIAVVLANYEMYAAMPLREKFFIIPFLFCSSIQVCRNIVLLSDRILPVIHADNNSSSKKTLKYFIVCFSLLAGVYLLVFIFSEYPGSICSDSMNQIQQILDNNYSNHHPVYQTFLIRLFFKAGMGIFHDVNAAIASYTVFQILFMAMVFAFAITNIMILGAPDIFCVCSLLWFMLMPCHITFSFTIWKDSLYGAFICLFVTCILRNVKKVGTNSLFNHLTVLLSAVGTCILRSNGLIAFLIYLVVFALVMEKNEKQLLKILVIAAVISIVLKHPVLKSLSITQPDTVESLSIPVQQIARVANEGGQFTENEAEFIENIIPVERMAQEYNPSIYDYVKNLIRSEGNQEYIKNNRADFFRTWLSVVTHHPILATRAWVDQTSGYWNPCSYYWMKWWDGVCEENGIQRIVKSEKIFNLFHQYIYAFINSSGFLGLTYNIGFHIWIIYFCLALCAYRGNKNWYIYFPVITLIGTLLLATPMHDEFRYAYFVFTCFPTILFATLMADDCDEHKQKS